MKIKSKSTSLENLFFFKKVVFDDDDDDDEKCLFATQIIEHTGHSLLIRVIHV